MPRSNRLILLREYQQKAQKPKKEPGQRHLLNNQKLTIHGLSATTQYENRSFVKTVASAGYNSKILLRGFPMITILIATGTK